jgi:predicted DNA-binding transcriptional regulator AlpA
MDKRGFNCQEALQYLGIKRRAFDKYFRPALNPIRLGTSVVFDRIDLDRLLEEHKSRNGRPVEKGVHTWAEHNPASIKISKASGGLIRSTKALDFATVSSDLKKRNPG